MPNPTAADHDDSPELLTRDQVAELLAVSPSTVKKLTRQGQLRPTRIGRCLRYRRDAVDELIIRGSVPYSPTAPEENS